MEATAANGHLMIYSVGAYNKNGDPIYSQWNAQHSDNCPCLTSEDW
jgi:hypothetical protein